MSVLVPTLVAAVAALAQSPVRDYAPTEWVVLGPFPNEPIASPGPDGVTRAGFDRDFLTTLGGEAGAKLGPASTVPGAKAISVKGGSAAPIDLATLFPPSDNRVAYAYGVFRADKAQTLRGFLGSDDAAKVWLNGRLVHSMWTPGRGITPRQDSFDLPVVEGENRLLVKVDNAVGGWGFQLNILDDDGLAALRLREAAKNLADNEIAAPGGGYLLTSETFPTLDYKNRGLVEAFLSREPLSVVWYDAQAKVVTKAEKPGTYFAYVQGKAANGLPTKRLVTFARVHPSWIDWLQGLFVNGFELPMPATKPPELEMPDAQWEAGRSAFGQAASLGLAQTMLTSPTGAEVAAVLLKPADLAVPATPFGARVAVAQMQLNVKRAILGTQSPGLKPVRKAPTPAPVLRLGTAEEAGMAPDTVARLRPVLEAWAKEEGRPFTAVLARKGVVFLHDGFGVPKETLFYPASIGKAFAGIVFAQFVDQGLIAADEPIGKYLPDWPTDGPKAVTFRNLFTHTSGTAGHMTYGGFWNPFLESAFSMWLPDLEPGVRFAYGGDGNNIAAKAMELVSGKPMAQLLTDRLFGPLGADSIYEPDLGFAARATAWDVAKVAQMLANHGRYGDVELMSEATFQAMLPRPLAPYMPRLEDKQLEWGFGLSWMMDPDGPRDRGALGPNVIGHGSASSSIFRVDLDSGLIAVFGRYGVGNEAKHAEYREKTMRTLKECLR